jgi:hypothetical protein
MGLRSRAGDFVGDPPHDSLTSASPRCVGLWHDSVVRLSAREVRSALLSGRAIVKKIVATHYRFVAKTPRDIWYDPSGLWVKITTTVKDGSLVEWVLK